MNRRVAFFRMRASGEKYFDILESMEEGTADFLFTSLSGRDARLDAFDALSKANLPLLHTAGSEASLEDIFLRLVTGKEEESA